MLIHKSRIKNTYQNLPNELYKNCKPETISNPKLLIFNKKLATDLKLDQKINTSELVNLLSGNENLKNSKSIAQAYAGHQFGQLNILGDGRAHLLGEIDISSEHDQINQQANYQLVDIQLKGSGRTPYSRGGDGKASLAPMLREYIISEGMYALGIPSSRSLAVVTTGDDVYRQQIEQGAVLTRIASSHLRVGTFVYASMLSHEDDDTHVLAQLVQYSIDRHYPEINDKQQKLADKAMSLLKSVMHKQASLVAHWQRVGFVHGVMNTDNITISGETIDYGPCAFIDNYHENKVFSSIDYQGRYAFGNQMPIMWWNMARFAESLLPVIQYDDEEAEHAIERVTTIIDSFGEIYHEKWSAMLCSKIGLANNEKNFKFAKSLLLLIQEKELDYTNTFVSLTNIAKHLLTEPPVTTTIADTVKNIATEHKLLDDSEFLQWLALWTDKLMHENKSIDKNSDCVVLMQTNNPAFIARNHLVEEALSEAAQLNIDDLDTNIILDKFNRLLEVIQQPYNYDLNIDVKYKKPANHDWTASYKTFCGT